nr:reverse transcriptase domain-containing protein [Tanacetum cinerariifolium]
MSSSFILCLGDLDRSRLIGDFDHSHLILEKTLVLRLRECLDAGPPRSCITGFFPFPVVFSTADVGWLGAVCSGLLMCISTRSNSSHLFYPLRDPESLIRRRNLGEPSSLFDFEEVMNNNQNQDPPPQNGPPSMLEMMNKNFSEMMRQFQKIKAVDMKCKTCRGPHYFTECPAVNGYTQETAYDTTGNYNSGGNSYQPQGDRNLLSHRSNNYLEPPGFNQPNVQNRFNQNQNQSYNPNQGNNQENYQNQGSNFNQGKNQNQVFNQNQGHANNFNQAPTYHTTTHQSQVVPQVGEFQAYKKANDVVMQNMQTKMTSLTNSKLKLKNMFGQFMKVNSASSSGTVSLPSNTVLNPREDLKAITTRSGVALAGPSVSPSSSSKEPSLVSTSFSAMMPEVTKDTVQPSTENIQPLVAQKRNPIYEPIVTPNPKPTIPYPSRVNKQKLHEKDDNLALKFIEIFRNLHFELSFTDALLHMPRFALMFKSLLNNKEKLFDLATTLVNENCSAIILKKLPEKLGDLGKRPFLRTGRALIDVYGEELTLRVDDEAITFKVGQTSK